MHQLLRPNLASEQRGRRRQGALATVIIALSAALVLPSPVAADAFSAQVYIFTRDPVGEVSTDYCSRAGIVDVARNSSQVLAFLDDAGAGNCAGSVNQVPAGWIGTKAQGYRNGVLCGTSGWYYNTDPASNWQLRITLCSNPAGNQEFSSSSWIRAYTGQGGYWENCCWPVSPRLNY